jgi:hypothetical protein
MIILDQVDPYPQQKNIMVLCVYLLPVDAPNEWTP